MGTIVTILRGRLLQKFCFDFSLQMPRKRFRKSSRGECDIFCYKKAYDEPKTDISLRKAAENHRVNYNTYIYFFAAIRTEARCNGKS
jgi:hypothetical protein